MLFFQFNTKYTVLSQQKGSWNQSIQVTDPRKLCFSSDGLCFVKY